MTAAPPIQAQLLAGLAAFRQATAQGIVEDTVIVRMAVVAMWDSSPGKHTRIPFLTPLMLAEGRVAFQRLRDAEVKLPEKRRMPADAFARKALEVMWVAAETERLFTEAKEGVR